MCSLFGQITCNKFSSSYLRIVPSGIALFTRMKKVYHCRNVSNVYMYDKSTTRYLTGALRSTLETPNSIVVYITPKSVNIEDFALCWTKMLHVTYTCISKYQTLQWKFVSTPYNTPCSLMDRLSSLPWMHTLEMLAWSCILIIIEWIDHNLYKMWSLSRTEHCWLDAIFIM